ncbi:DNA polymerase-4 [Thermocatellispora tengchongensis]|uniref:DNA polymerase IV n=1 Tax=Thermocatellispora tengchongensis TaxID=1073253 RepID=A0A840NZR2_9ACTN|nr:DNA polymerase IV [Thermocatellispora tengchongensis]MBB5131696.1 DNA polymerase-4 [Thermocatellispora tengchongensis]
MSRKQQVPKVAAVQGADDTGCPILHVDMDAFYASVELLDRPELVGKPVIIGAAGLRGVVLSATYEARAFGVHSAMPMTRARRLCPHAVVIPPSHGKYAEVSKGVMEIFRAITPQVEPIASDEAFLDVGGARLRLGSPAQIAAMIRAEVRERYGITCSVGVASSKFVAKLASRQCKPDGLLVVPADRVVEFLHPLPVGALWGVGERTEQALVRLGINTVGDLARVPLATLRRELGHAAGTHLAALAWGRDERAVTAHVPDKSIGAEETFPADVDDPEAIRRELLRLSERVAARLRAGGHVGRTVSVKLRRSDFTTITRSRTLREPTDVAQEIYVTVCDLYAAAGLERVRLRLVGVRVENLRGADSAVRQLTLGERESGWREAERAMDKAVRRFGPDAVRPASLVRPKFDGIDL